MTSTALPDPAAVRRKNTRFFLIIATIVDVLAWPVAAFWGVMSIMASDAGTTPAISTYINVTITLPLAMLVAPIAAWISFAMKRERLAIILMLVPVAWAMLSFALMFTL